MQTYWQNTTATGNIDRGLYIILPLRYQGSFQSITVDKEDPELSKLIFDTSDFTELLSAGMGILLKESALTANYRKR